MSKISGNGNSCIRFIKGAHTLQGDKFIGALKVQPIPTNWKPEGLAVIAKDTTAITEGTTLNLVCMESTFNAGKLVKVVTTYNHHIGFVYLELIGKASRKLTWKPNPKGLLAMVASRLLMLHC